MFKGSGGEIEAGGGVVCSILARESSCGSVVLSFHWSQKAVENPI